MLANCVCVCMGVGVCSSFWPKAMSGLWPKCLPVCDFYAPPSPIVVNRQRQSMRQSVRQLVTYSMRDAAVLIHLICERTFMRCCLMRCARNVGNAFFLLLASIKIQIQHDACQGNKPTIYTQAPRPHLSGGRGERGSGDTSFACRQRNTSSDANNKIKKFFNLCMRHLTAMMTCVCVRVCVCAPRPPAQLAQAHAHAQAEPIKQVNYAHMWPTLKSLLGIFITSAA